MSLSYCLPTIREATCTTCHVVWLARADTILLSISEWALPIVVPVILRLIVCCLLKSSIKLLRRLRISLWMRRSMPHGKLEGLSWLNWADLNRVWWRVEATMILVRVLGIVFSYRPLPHVFVLGCVHFYSRVASLELLIKWTIRTQSRELIL